MRALFTASATIAAVLHSQAGPINASTPASYWYNCCLTALVSTHAVSFQIYLSLCPANSCGLELTFSTASVMPEAYMLQQYS